MINSDFRLRFTGKQIKPGIVRSKDIAEVIEAFENMIAVIVLRDNPELKRESIIVGLDGITDASLGLSFAVNLPQLTQPALEEIIGGIVGKTIANLPHQARHSLKKFKKFTKQYDCEAELSTSSNDAQLALITPTTEIPEPRKLTGITTVYGEITRVGGVIPKAQLKTINDTVIYCNINETIARQLGERLYTQVGVTGQAVWNAETMEIESLDIHSVSPYNETPITKAFANLQNIVGAKFDGINDVPAYATALRRGDV